MRVFDRITNETVDISACDIIGFLQYVFLYENPEEAPLTAFLILPLNSEEWTDDVRMPSEVLFEDPFTAEEENCILKIPSVAGQGMSRHDALIRLRTARQNWFKQK
ncbi:MAG: hypothetical protein KDC56_05755 [Flavobacteriaceae bacterium]|nr:hypothetical protein [Flavobacteriaceae bacterium]